MPTKPRPVPWPEVADLVGDLLEWIAKEGNVEPDAARKRSPVEIAKGILQAGPDQESLLAVAAKAVISLEKYRAADHRDEFAALRHDLSQAELNLLYSDKIEREADNAIRGLAERLAHIRRLVRKVGERQHQRIDLVARTRKPERIPTLQAKNQSEVNELGRDLDALSEAAEQFSVNFHKFNHARTEFPLTTRTRSL